MLQKSLKYKNQLSDLDETSDSRLISEQARTKVAVVDDDKETARVFSEYLAIKGLDVVGIGYDGKQAVELFKKQKPDVIFLDLAMPDYDGFYGLRNIKKINPNAKVIIVTSDLTLATKRKLEKLKASALIYKPYDIDNLIATIDKVNTSTKSLNISTKRKLSKKLIEMMNDENVKIWGR